ncbi:kinesin-like protein KIF16B isoform X4 [Choloepus didactylus]|nr:kinesin-like protein KIF16B isoform X4 [Choloepus didactylus]
MTDLSKSCENLSAVMLYNPGLEFERQQREELEKLESKRKLIEEMEEKQKSDKAELERMQQEVETQRKETEIVQLQIRKQEESLKRRSFHIESKLKDLLAEKEKFEEERLREQQEIELQKKKQEEEHFLRVKEELQRLQELNSNEKAEKIQIFRELDWLKKEKEEQYAKLELEKKRLEEQEKEQVMLVAHLEEELREKQEMIQLLRRGEVQRVEEERRDLEDIRESLLRVKEARAEGEDDVEELEKAQLHFLEFKRRQLVKLANLEQDLVQQKDLLKKEVKEEQETLERLKWETEDEFRLLEENNGSVTSVTQVAEDLEKMKPVEYRLQYKERQLQYLLQNHLPTLLEEKQRAFEILDRGPLGLDNTLYQVEKEMEEKEEQLAQYQANASQLQKLQATFEFAANIARQEEKVRKKEKEILESREKQQRLALEQAVAQLERRHCALQRRSTLGMEIEEQRQKLATLNSRSSEQSGLQATLEAEQEALEKDRERLEHEIQQLKQKICEVDGVQKAHHDVLEKRAPSSGLPPSTEKSQAHLHPLTDARINAYIEEEVQRRLQDLYRVISDDSSTPADMTKDNEKLHNGTIQRKLKYEKGQSWLARYLVPLLPEGATGEERMEMGQNKHWSHPMTWSFADPETSSSAPQERAPQPRVPPSLQEVVPDSPCPEHACNFEPKYLNRPKISLCSLKESNTSHAEHFQGKSENFSQKDEHSLESESSWTLLQHTSQKVSINNGNKQSRQSKVLCFILSEGVSSEELVSHKAHQSIMTSVFHGEQQAEKELAAENTSSPKSLINTRTELNSGLGYFYHKFSDLYKETSNHLLEAGTRVMTQARHVGGLLDPCGLTSPVTTFIRNLPLLRPLTLDRPLMSLVASSDSPVPRARVSSSEEAGGLRLAESAMPHRAPAFTASGLPGSSPSSVVRLGYGDAGKNSAFKQTLVQFPDQMLKLQERPLEDFLEHVAYSLPEPLGDVNEVKGIYWLAVANCADPNPQPACLLLLRSTLYALVLSDNHPGSLGVFHVLPLSGLKEIQVGFGGQCVRFLGSVKGLLLTVFSYNKNLSQQLCCHLLCVLLTESEAAACTDHPLLKQDLVQLSLDWKAEIPDLVLANGVRLSSKFQNTLVDIIYFLHGNMEVNIPCLAEVQLLLYTTVRVEGDGGQGRCQSLVLLNTHIALVREDGVFHPPSKSLNISPPRAQLDVLKCRALREFRCVIVPDKKNVSAVELVFLQKPNLTSDSRRSPSEPSQVSRNVQFTTRLHLHGGQNGDPEIWKLTLNSQDEALWLISHLTRF